MVSIWLIDLSSSVKVELPKAKYLLTPMRPNTTVKLTMRARLLQLCVYVLGATRITSLHNLRVKGLASLYTNHDCTVMVEFGHVVLEVKRLRQPNHNDQRLPSITAATQCNETYGIMASVCRIFYTP